MMRIVTVVGARPQFVKAATVSRAIREAYAGQLAEVLIHTGQHHDEGMSQVFFEEMAIPAPQYHLGIAGGGHGAMTGRMLEAVETVLLRERPDWVVVHGDTNSTLAGALAAAKLHIPIAHVEAGLRSFNMRMPEEVNRILTDRISTLLFCPTGLAVENLRAEGVAKGIHQVGDVMYDAALFYRDRAREGSDCLARLALQPGGFALATCHRAENTDDPVRLQGILQGLAECAQRLPVVFPVHPRTRQRVEQLGLGDRLAGIQVVSPLPFLDMVALEQAARVILTDSGGVQKEAFFFGVPCITLRDETEWVETVTLGGNRLVGAEPARMAAALAEIEALPRGAAGTGMGIYGNGQAAREICALLLQGPPG